MKTTYAQQIWEAYNRQRSDKESLCVKECINGYKVYVRLHDCCAGPEYHSTRMIDQNTFEELISLGACKM